VTHLGADTVAMRSMTLMDLSLERRITLTDEPPAVRVEEHIRNESDRTWSYVWGHHPAIAATAGMRIDLPVGTLQVDEAFDDPDADLEPGAVTTWPATRYRDGAATTLDRIPDSKAERVCYLPDRPAGWAAVRDPASARGVGLAWDLRAFPHLWLWEQLHGDRFPFHGRASLVAIEPVSYWPGDGLAGAIERGQARTIAPGRQETAWLTLSLFEASDEAVTGVDAAGRVSASGDPTRTQR